MASVDVRQLELDSFMEDCPGSTNKTWGYYVYLTSDKTDEVDDSAVVAKLRGYSEAYFKHLWTQPYGEHMNAALHLAAVRLHDASSDQIRAHFEAHPYDPEEDVGPREHVVLVVDDEVLENVRAGPSPIISLPEHTGTDSRYYSKKRGSNGEKDVFVKALELGYDAGEEGEVHKSASRGRGCGVVWKGVLKVSPAGRIPNLVEDACNANNVMSSVMKPRLVAVIASNARSHAASSLLATTTQQA
ncbi:hypothetical protein KCU65_g8704, partial [Aureobasidium melanogenum]